MRHFPLAVFLFLMLTACDGSKEDASTLPSESSAKGVTTQASGCGSLDALKTAFPEATEVGFTKRQPIRLQPARAPVWPGRCVGWWTTYRQGSPGVDVSLTLYKTHEQAVAALSEAAYGPVESLANGALVRKHRGPAAVNGVPKRSVGLVSVYRNVFSSSLSIADKPISLAAQLALHRRIDEGVLALG
jgi:hypothetical protein